MKKIYLFLPIAFLFTGGLYYLFTGKAGDIKNTNIENSNNYCVISTPIDVTKYDLSNFVGRQAYYDFLLSKKSCEIWNIWDATIAKSNPNELSTVVAAFGQVLRSDNSEGRMYKIISARLYDKKRGEAEKSAIITVLSYAASPASLRDLLTFAKALESGDGGINERPRLLSESIEAIRTVYMKTSDGSRNWELSSVLENEWQGADDNEAPQTLGVIASGLAYLSKPSGVDLLIKTMSSVNKTSIKYISASRAISILKFNDSVETVLAPALIKYQGNDDVIKTVIRGLLSVDSADSAIALLRYADSIKNSDIYYYKWIRSELAKSENDDVKKVIASWSI